MPGNVDPIYTKVGEQAWATLTTANTAKDGTGTVSTVFTADATNGGRVFRLRAVPLGTNVASVLRIFLNNGSANTTAANNTMWDQVSLPATTNTETAALPVLEIPVNIALKPGYKINAVIGTTVAGGWAVVADGGQF